MTQDNVSAKSHRRWYQFSLAAVLWMMLVTAFSVVIGLEHWEKQRMTANFELRRISFKMIQREYENEKAEDRTEIEKLVRERTDLEIKLAAREHYRAIEASNSPADPVAAGSPGLN